MMQLPGRRFECVGSDRECRILAQLVLTHLGAKTGEEDPKLERLGSPRLVPCAPMRFPSRVLVAAPVGLHVPLDEGPEGRRVIAYMKRGAAVRRAPWRRVAFPTPAPNV